MAKILAMTVLGAFIVVLFSLNVEARGGGARGVGGAHPRGGYGRVGVGRVGERSLQRTPAMSRAALYSGAAGLGAAEGASAGSNNGEPIILPVETDQNQ